MSAFVFLKSLVENNIVKTQITQIIENAVFSVEDGITTL